MVKPMGHGSVLCGSVSPLPALVYSSSAPSVHYVWLLPCSTVHVLVLCGSLFLGYIQMYICTYWLKHRPKGQVATYNANVHSYCACCAWRQQINVDITTDGRSHVVWPVCVCIGHTGELCKNGWTSKPHQCYTRNST